ncbi:hypothetical protein HDE_09589 [Halotydeus destructor]|nr:hypothetical protein HDE_09589 [Halotydeus destructor]
MVLALLDYFLYETITETAILRAESQYSRMSIICFYRKHNPMLGLGNSSPYHVESFFSHEMLCFTNDRKAGYTDIPNDYIRDVMIYSVELGNLAAWQFNRFNLIYEASLSNEIGFEGNGSLVLEVIFTTYEASLLPAPYETDCIEYEQHLCLYRCMILNEKKHCAHQCSKASCLLNHVDPLAWTAYRDDTLTTSRAIITQAADLVKTNFIAKSTLSLLALNIFGLFGVFVGLSVLHVAHCIRRVTYKPSKPLKRTTVSIGYLAAMLHCMYFVSQYLQYEYTTEVYQGENNVILPRHAYAICLSQKLRNVSWPETVKRMPNLKRIVGRQALLTVHSQEKALFMTTISDKSMMRLETKYTVHRHRCYLLKMPDKYVEGLAFSGKSLSDMAESDLSIQIKKRYARAVYFAMLQTADGKDIVPSSLQYYHSSGLSRFRSMYTEVQSLPYPFKTACEVYGHGLWQGIILKTCLC